MVCLWLSGLERKKADPEVSWSLTFVSEIRFLIYINQKHSREYKRSYTEHTQVTLTPQPGLPPYQARSSTIWTHLQCSRCWSQAQINAKLVHTAVLTSYSYSSKRALLGVILFLILIRRSYPEARALCIARPSAQPIVEVVTVSISGVFGQ